MSSRYRRFYGSDIDTPIILPISYAVVVIAVAYCLGVQIVTPFDSAPTGYAISQPTHNIAAETQAIKAESFVRDAVKSSSPPPFRDSPHILVSGFNMLQPISTDAGSGDGSLQMKFLKVVPSAVDLIGAQVINSATGRICSSVDAEPIISAGEDTFKLLAKGCDDSVSDEAAAVTVYNVTLEYAVDIGSQKAMHKNTGQIRVLR